MSPPEFREVRPREALAVLELPEIHPGLFVLDAMVKEAPIEVLSATPIPPGRFLIVVTGAVGEVESAYHRGATLAERGGGNVPGNVTGDVMGRATGHITGQAAGRVTVHDRLFLADVAPAVLAALRPDRKEREIDALGIFETASVASCLDASDRLVKGADVRLEQLHLARGIAGRSFGVVTGRQDMVEAALELAEERGEHHARWVGSSLIARPDPSIARRVLGEPWGFFEGQEIL
ncbi:MAG: BMC domain-containing protein [Candidatus Eisenbacteria bacterium]|uniref:BMC domain-containing protein n=1 Tax=Eiseniibacteriota bacterium TaxID=2212470 RepID=A0A956SG58_UNCEI|nr:BMC domain-containing protein [Candidatus Eisenbacteria bacterium]MCB9462871.1 BMC domain-containing protein [Candidatus Eisenbacteria bacterium]